MKRLFLILVIGTISATAVADDLYFVSIQSDYQAAILRGMDARPVMRIGNGYLVLTDVSEANRLTKNLPEAQILASGIALDDLGLDTRPAGMPPVNFPLLFERDNIRIYRIDGGMVSDKDALSPADTLELDSLISLVSQDSLESYLYRLEAFHRRLTGTDSCRLDRVEIQGLRLRLGRYRHLHRVATVASRPG